jgi:beta-glucosidase
LKQRKPAKIRLRPGMTTAEINRVTEEILPRLTLDEKVYFMSGSIMNKYRFMIDRKYNYHPWVAGGSRRFGIPPVKFCDGPRGVVCGHSTCFPVAMARAASWDPGLETEIGDAIGKEVRAHKGNYFGGVCINLLRHPAWGRAQETYGEDPHLLGEMGAALVRGVQKHNVMACVKHYAANSIENSRFRVDVRMDERTLREVYLPHFKRCVDEGAASVMGAYNKFRGEHCCQNSYLLKDILKNEWGFAGFVISDFFWGVRDTVKAANNGLDIEMPVTNCYGRKLVEAVRQGLVAETAIDEAVRRIIRTVLKFNLAPDPQKYPKELIACREHRALAQRAAEESMVLLKNQSGAGDRPVLPLDGTKIKKLAVLGELATAPNIGDYGSSCVHPSHVVTILEGLQQRLGAEAVLYCDGKDLEAAKEAARTADAVIIVAGYRPNEEGEQIYNVEEGTRPPRGMEAPGGDRQRLTLYERDLRLIEAVTPVNKNSVVVLIGGSAIIMEEWKEKAAAILMAWYPGMEGGHALARILFGEVNPSGKLPFTIPAREEDLPFFNDRIDAIDYGYYHGYTLFEKQGLRAAFPFGFGLSYTSFAYSNLRVETGDDALLVSFDLENTGDRAGAEIAQVYIGLEQSAVDRPVKLLKGFKKVFLQPGEKKQVTIAVKYADLAWYNPEKKAWEIEKMDYTAYAGGSSRPEDLLATKFSL